MKRFDCQRIIGGLLICLLIGGCAHARSAKKTDGEVLLGPKPVFVQMRAFQMLTEAEPGSPNFEKARIEYLFERLSKTGYNFIRNDKTYSNARAVIHLRWKYLKYRDEAKTAEGFVDHVAVGSRISGRPYLVKTEESQFYLLKMVFHNELRILEEAYQAHEKARQQQLLTGAEAADEPPQEVAEKVKEEPLKADNLKTDE